MSRHADLVYAAVGSGEATSSLIASWRRCVVAHGLHPDQAYKPERDVNALRDALERDALMVAVAKTRIGELFDAVGGINSVIMLADRNGLVLLQYDGQLPGLHGPRAFDKVGLRFAEADLGSGPIGTVLVEERAVAFAPGQCFSQEAAALSCMGAPIFGSDGHVVGVLACGHADPAAGKRTIFDKMLFMLLSQFARRIGLEMFAQAFPDAKLVQVAAGNTSSAFVAVSPDDLVLGATRSARRSLGLTEARLKTPFNVRELFGHPGIQNLAAAEARLIEQTMLRHAYNRSAVAKALGISRSTLYRKLDELERRGDAFGTDMRTRK